MKTKRHIRNLRSVRIALFTLAVIGSAAAAFFLCEHILMCHGLGNLPSSLPPLPANYGDFITNAR